jgi:hypothetical protein
VIATVLIINVVGLLLAIVIATEALGSPMGRLPKATPPEPKATLPELNVTGGLGAGV